MFQSDAKGYPSTTNGGSDKFASAHFNDNKAKVQPFEAAAQHHQELDKIDENDAI